MHRPRDIAFLVTLLFSVFSHSNGFEPPDIAHDITMYSTIKASSTCDTDIGIDRCNDTCPGRTVYPAPENLLQPLPASCSGLSLPNDAPKAVDRDKGYVQYSSDGDCQTVSRTLVPGSSDYFTLSLWVNTNCTNW